jgi:putative ABC transport system substrate-binding protein
MDRRAFIGTLAGGLLVPPLVARAQPAGKVWRIGVLGVVPAPAMEEVFRQALRDRGYKNEDVFLELRWSEGRLERLPSLAEELVRLQVDVIVTVNTAAQAAKNATRAIPIVMATSAHPDQLGLIDSLAKPGGNVTGLTLDTGPEIAERCFNSSRKPLLGLPGSEPSSQPEASGRRNLEHGPARLAWRRKHWE